MRTIEAYVYRRALDIYATVVSEGIMNASTAMQQMEAELSLAYGPSNPRYELLRRLYLYSIGRQGGVNGPREGRSLWVKRSDARGRSAGLWIVALPNRTLRGAFSVRMRMHRACHE